jgi:membrane protein YdbS with pleckstrin-like domain
VTSLRRRRAETDVVGSAVPAARQQAPDPYSGAGRTPDRSATPDDEAFVERPPSVMRRIGQGLAEMRRRVLPLPDEVIDQYLGNGERMIHNDHPSFRSFMVQNTLLFAGFLIVAVLFLGITFSGSLLAAAFLLLVLCVVLLVLVLKRLGDRYTSYVVTDTRIMRISGVISRRAHSIPWVRVTDLTIEQSLTGRLFGYATLHIESANEDSGLRDLDGVSDPMQFNQFVVDMVVAKQGTISPKWEQTGEPAPIGLGRGLKRIRLSRRRSADGEDGSTTSGGSGSPGEGRQRSRQGQAGSTGLADADDIESLDPEVLAAQLKAAASEPDLPWGK